MSMQSCAVLCLNLACAVGMLTMGMSAMGMSALGKSALGKSPGAAHAGDRNGCAILAAIVADETSRSARFDLSGSALVANLGNAVELHTCNQTARTVTDAFAGALSNFGVRIVWDAHAIDHRTICDSADLIRCMPGVLPSETAVIGQIVIHDSWSAVQHSVHISMPFGSASDVSHFKSSALRTRIGRALDQKLTVPSRAGATHE